MRGMGADSYRFQEVCENGHYFVRSFDDWTAYCPKCGKQVVWDNPFCDDPECVDPDEDSGFVQIKDIPVKVLSEPPKNPEHRPVYGFASSLQKMIQEKVRK